MFPLSSGRVTSILRWLALPIFLCCVNSCRENAPSSPVVPPPAIRVAFPHLSYSAFDNWKYSPRGIRIPSSQFRTAWRVQDTAATAFGYSDVIVVVDSTLGSVSENPDSLATLTTRYFRLTEDGGVAEYGFLARLLALRDSISTVPSWDTLLLPSRQGGSSWIIASPDSTVSQPYAGRCLPDLETVYDNVNGNAEAVPAYHVEVTGEHLILELWFGGTPGSILRVWDQSDVLYNRTFQEVRLRQVGG
jgi:hypothetical protein